MTALLVILISSMLLKSWKTTTLLIPIMMVYTSLYLFSPMSTPIVLSHIISVDTMSVLLIMLTLWITNLMMMSSLKIKYTRANPTLFMNSTLLLCIVLIISFSVNSLDYFYIGFEASLIPTLVIILTWGYQPERLQAGMYLMMYTVTASLPLLGAIALMTAEDVSLMFYSCPTYDLPHPLISLPLVVALLVKMPMYLTHLWLPKAHVEAPVAGSMILASILLKLGGYGLLRVMSMFPQVSCLDRITIPVSVTGALLTSILCIRQTDMKAMIAYSSVSHMAFVITGIFTMNKWGWEGSLITMIAHGFISSGLFAAANMYYENSLSRNLMLNTGLMMITPTMAMWWFLMIAGNMAAPPFINLLGEIILITSAAAYSLATPLFMIICSFFTVCYSMVLYTSLHHGPTNKNLNFFNTPPIYYTIMSLHLAPTLLMIFSASQLISWT